MVPHKMTRREFLTAAAASTAGVALASCGVTPTAVPQPAPKVETRIVENVVTATPVVPKPVSIVFWFGGPYMVTVKGMEDVVKGAGDYERYLTKKFMQQNPNVQIEPLMVSWSDIDKKVPAAIAGGAPPDVLLDTLNRTAGYYYQGAVEAVESLFEQDKADYYPSIWNQYTLKGHLHALPTHYNLTGLLIINKAIWDAAGKGNLLPTLEKPDWTIEQFETAIRAVASPKLWPFAMQVSQSSGDYRNLAWMWGHGAKVFDSADYSKVWLNSPEGVASWKWLKKLLDEGLMAPGPSTATNAAIRTLFWSGQVGMLGGELGYWDMAAQAKRDGVLKEPFDMIMVQVPHIAGKPPTPFAFGGSGFVMFKQKDDYKKKAIADFMRFMTASDVEREYGVNYGEFPARKSTGIPLAGNPWYEANLAWAAKNGLADQGHAVPCYPEVRELMPPEMRPCSWARKRQSRQ